MENEKVVLTRTGRRPLAFNGQKIASATTWDHNATRWTKVQIFETDTGKVVVGIGFVTCWQGEEDRYTAEVFADRSAAMLHIEEFASTLASGIANELKIAEMI